MKTKTRFHKLTAWLLTLAMLMTFIPSFTLGVSAAEITPTEPILTTVKYDIDGDDTMDEVYEITTAAELYWFAGLVNGTLDGVAQNSSANAVLAADIVVNENLLSDKITVSSDGTATVNNGQEVVSWEPIGHVVNTDYDSAWEIDVYYSGTFDGQGYTISGLYLNDTTKSRQYIGLFGQTNGTIENVKIADSYFYAKSNVGGVVGYNESGTIENCTNGATVIVPYTGSNVRGGGVVGFNDNGTVKNCTNNGYVQGGSNCIVGGIAGQSIGSATMIEDCTNNGTISATSSAGGIVGKLGGDILATPADAGSVKDCTNTGDVTGITSNIGGIVGAAETKTTPGEISGCVNEGKVTATGSTSNVVGGIIGYNQGVSVSECSNKGTIEAKEYVGGIVGQHRVGYEITACGNFGDIVCSYNGYTGGIVGEVIRTTSSLTVSKCYNTGTVDGSGIIGYSGGTFTSGSENSRIIVKNCYNTGVVDVGGLIGSASRTDVESCYNAGSSSAAIVSSNTNSSVTNCYYLSTSATNSTHGGTSLTKEQMTDDTSWKTNFAGFDTNIWSKPANDGETLYLPKLDDYQPFLGEAPPYPHLDIYKRERHNNHSNL